MIETTINPLTSALVVIDLQKGIINRLTAPYEAETVIKNAALLAEAFRSKHMPVFLIHVSASTDGKDSLHPIVDEPMQIHTPPPDWSEIVPEMGPKSEDFVITKHQWGAFYGTELDLELRRRGITTIVLCGISTNIGVESTARFAYEYGYNQVFVEDAMTSMSAEDHYFAIKNIFPRIGLVRDAKTVLASLKTVV